MKGVTYIRLRYKPTAECQDCGWKSGVPYIYSSNAGRSIRSNAERHCQATGHDVDVVIEDRTTYSREASHDL